jgi:bifunctional non-homologous end joining protein LigD
MAAKKTASTNSTAKSAPARKPAPRKRSQASAADQVDTQLARYRSMRDFDITAEPAGGTRASSKRRGATKLPFVVQKHAASHLHYDFRLGWNGVLKSWACAKGPSYYPKDRRLAVEVEDHPIEYGGFEGIIPRGQYGGGTVMVWDQGTWLPQLGYENVTGALREGHLKFTLEGTKLHGKWALIRMTPRDDKPSSKPNWLLIKEHDPFERGPNQPAITDEAPNSAVTGRSLEQIAAEEDHVWNSKDTAKPGQAWHRKNSSSSKKSVILSEGSQLHREPQPKDPDATRPAKTAGPFSTADLKKLPREPQPGFLSPQLALEATAPPATGDWLHELKLDGYRIQARKSGKQVQLLTRKGLDWTHRMTSVAKAVAALPVHDATLDGELVVLGPDGNASFAALQASFQDGESHPLTYFAFDLLHLDGHNTRDLPLRQRKQLLTSLLPQEDETLRLSEDIVGDGASIFQHACKLHAEGIISKRADAPYRSARNASWLKSKCLREQEFVIAGFTPSTEGPGRIGSLILGYYETAGHAKAKPAKLIYAGRTGTGFTQKLKRDLHKQLTAIQAPDSPFASIPREARRGVTFVEPKLVAQVRFATWTADNLVRQAAFLSLREDKPAPEVTREEPTVAPTPKHTATHSATHRAHPTTQAAKTTKPLPSSLLPLPLHLTHPDKVLDPASGLTKRQLADYYATVAEHMLPHIAGRPLSLVRCPEGSGKPCFFQKHVNAMLPKGIGSVDVPDKKTGKPEPYITLDNVEALVGLAQMGVLEVHPWGSRNVDLEHPDRLIFDLDPSETVPWPTLCAAAAEVRKRLKRAGLESFLKLTGGKGLHIVAPIEPTLTWAELKSAAHNFVLSMERENPSLYLTKMSKSARKDKIYLDYLRNERGATAVAPFSPRARPGAHVSLPLPWSALKEGQLPVFAVHDLADWKQRLRSDPWKAMLSIRQRLDPKIFDTP